MLVLDVAKPHSETLLATSGNRRRSEKSRQENRRLMMDRIGFHLRAYMVQ
jgi:hypothetical protein